MKKKWIVILPLFTLFFLPSCFFFHPTDFITDKNTDSHNTGKEYTTYKTPNYTSAYKTKNLNKDTIALGMEQRYLPSTGNSKILVVPVEMMDDRFSEHELDMIEKGFFGKSEETGWESVSSFYEKSSYDKLHITGEVSPVIRLSSTTAEAEKTAENYNKKNVTYTDYILKAVLQELANNSNIDLTQYDTDQDGYIDGIWMVYSPKYNSKSDFYWAYTTWTSDDTSFQGMKACCYAWASVDFFTQKNYATLFNQTNVADSHTFIHETGHMLGLDDYYSYDYDYSISTRSGNSDTPVGGVDMMDYNIGDHDSFSKYLLGWVKPTVLTKEYLAANSNKLTLHSLNQSGESYLLPVYKDGKASFNQTPFDEYLLIEYYTPDGLNQQDSESKYANNLSTYSIPGVLVYHINASVGKLIFNSKKEIVWDGYKYDKLPDYDASTWGYNFLYSLIYSNTASRSYDTELKDEGMSYYRGRLISLLPASGKRINGAKSGYSSNTSLYRVGQCFGKDGVYSEFRFDDGSKPQFSFEVTETSTKDCMLEFSTL